MQRIGPFVILDLKIDVMNEFFYLRCLKNVRIVRQVIVTPPVSRACVLINIPLLGSHDRKNTYNRAIIRPPHDIPDTTDRIAGDRPAGWPFRRTHYIYSYEGGLDQPGGAAIIHCRSSKYHLPSGSNFVNVLYYM